MTTGNGSGSSVPAAPVWPPALWWPFEARGVGPSCGIRAGPTTPRVLRLASRCRGRNRQDSRTTKAVASLSLAQCWLLPGAWQVLLEPMSSVTRFQNKEVLQLRPPNRGSWRKPRPTFAKCGETRYCAPQHRHGPMGPFSRLRPLRRSQRASLDPSSRTPLSG